MIFRRWWGFGFSGCDVSVNVAADDYLPLTEVGGDGGGTYATLDDMFKPGACDFFFKLDEGMVFFFRHRTCFLSKYPFCGEEALAAGMIFYCFVWKMLINDSDEWIKLTSGNVII